MPESLERRHRQREIREGDFSLTSGDVCTPAQTSGVKKNFILLVKSYGQPVLFLFYSL